MKLSKQEKESLEEYHEDIEPFYDYIKTPEKATQKADDFKEYDENGDLVE